MLTPVVAVTFTRGSVHSHGSSLNVMQAQDEELYEELCERGQTRVHWNSCTLPR
jgi:hypothetical protein